MALLFLKLTITPAVITLATLVARRYGPAVGGWLIGLPLTNGPVALLLTLEHGPEFTARVAKGFVAGISGEVAFVLAYFASVRRGRGWASCVAIASVAYIVIGLALDAATRSFALLLTVAICALFTGLRILPRRAVATRPAGRFELPARIVLATSLVVAVTALASTFGAGPSGVATTFPLMSSLLAVCVHRADGPDAAVAVYRGLLAGLFALMAFASTLVIVLSRLPVAAAFGLAAVLTLSIQLGSLRAVRRTAVAA
ncbi:MAG TPA: hypothetical protein VMV08_06330 [Gaiellaceae bacterium]|nr:hypothetical protein [Gaiellaceae bacterium]